MASLRGGPSALRKKSSHKRRILFLITSLDQGGAEQVLYDIATGLDRDLWELVVVAMRGRGPYFQKLRVAGVAVESLDIQGKFAPTAMVRLILKIGTFRPHIIHSHLFHADLPGRFASLLARGLKRALFISHQHIPEQRFLPMRQVLDRGTRGLVDSYVCVSQAVADHVQGQLKLPEQRVSIIPNGRDLKPFLTLELEAKDSEIWELGTVGRLDEQKDQALLLEVLGELKKRGRRFHCVIAGEGSLREPLLKQREELGLSETEIELLGRRDDVPRLLEAMDLFILTSKYEGLPIAAIEAMAAGRPIVATRVPGIIDVIEESYGALVDYRDAKGLADEIERLMADRSLRQKMAVAGREKARNDYSRERMLRDLTAHYEQLLATRNQ